ncbi:MAG: hypothetical protein ACE5GL_09835 [Calditrichia bacterium]
MESAEGMKKVKGKWKLGEIVAGFVYYIPKRLTEGGRDNFGLEISECGLKVSRGLVSGELWMAERENG